MSIPEPDDDKPLPPEQQRIVARVRWLMLISGFATLLGIAVVVGVIGYRFFRANGSVAPAEVTALLPKGTALQCDSARGLKAQLEWAPWRGKRPRPGPLPGDSAASSP